MEANIFIQVINLCITVMLICQILFAFVFNAKWKKEHFRWARVWLDAITVNGIMLILAQSAYFIFNYDKILELLFLIIIIWLFVQALGLRVRYATSEMITIIFNELKKEIKKET